jgi:hypothetical protein
MFHQSTWCWFHKGKGVRRLADNLNRGTWKFGINCWPFGAHEYLQVCCLNDMYLMVEDNTKLAFVIVTYSYPA